MGILDIFRPKWKHSHYAVRRSAVTELTDEAILSEVAQNDEESSVREAAFKKLTDQKVLAEIAKDAEHYYVRTAAVEKLTDQAVLAVIAQNDEHCEVRKAAVEKLTDQTLLADIAQNDEAPYVVESALEELTDQAVLGETAKSAQDPYVRKATLQKLTDQTVLAEVAENDEEWNVREAAVDKLTNQTFLAEIAKSNEYWDVRIAATKKLTDQTVLTEIAESNECLGVREAALKNIVDEKRKVSAILKALNSKYYVIRIGAIYAISELVNDIVRSDALEQIVERLEHLYVEDHEKKTMLEAVWEDEPNEIEVCYVRDALKDVLDILWPPMWELQFSPNDMSAKRRFLAIATRDYFSDDEDRIIERIPGLDEDRSSQLVAKYGIEVISSVDSGNPYDVHYEIQSARMKAAEAFAEKHNRELALS